MFYENFTDLFHKKSAPRHFFCEKVLAPSFFRPKKFPPRHFFFRKSVSLVIFSSQKLLAAHPAAPGVNFVNLVNFAPSLRERSFIKVYGGRDRFRDHEIFPVYLGGS